MASIGLLYGTGFYVGDGLVGEASAAAGYIYVPRSTYLPGILRSILLAPLLVWRLSHA